MKYTWRKVIELCLFKEILQFIRFYARTLSKMKQPNFHTKTSKLYASVVQAQGLA